MTAGWFFKSLTSWVPGTSSSSVCSFFSELTVAFTVFFALPCTQDFVEGHSSPSCLHRQDHTCLTFFIQSANPSPPTRALLQSRGAHCSQREESRHYTLQSSLFLFSAPWRQRDSHQHLKIRFHISVTSCPHYWQWVALLNVCSSSKSPVPTASLSVDRPAFACLECMEFSGRNSLAFWVSTWKIPSKPPQPPSFFGGRGGLSLSG